MELRLAEIKKLEGTITLKSGLHIGSGDTEMHIGGIDSPVIKHIHTLEPYIPGSSLKGKVRSMLEMESGLMAITEGNVVSNSTIGKVDKVEDEKEKLKNKCKAILKIFGSSGDDIKDETAFGPTRAYFSDCYLNEVWKNKAKENRWLLTEQKSENVINRIKGTAEHPRFIERVPEGTQFDFLIAFRILENGEESLFDVLLCGIKLVEMDTLGGSGSRGYGRIAFSFKDMKINERFKSLDPFRDLNQSAKES
jgi:CRISPR-associated protein Csm3